VDTDRRGVLMGRWRGLMKALLLVAKPKDRELSKTWYNIFTISNTVKPLSIVPG
jgi:hypothetical protein